MAVSNQALLLHGMRALISARRSVHQRPSDRSLLSGFVGMGGAAAAISEESCNRGNALERERKRLFVMATFPQLLLV